MPLRLLLLIALALSVLPVSAMAGDWVLVANPKAGIKRLTQDEVTNIYLGRYRRLPSGVTAEPVDQPADSQLRASFYRNLVNKSLAEINSYWARLIFSGNTKPPRVVIGSDEAIQFVLANPGALAYIERGKVSPRVSVVFELAD